MPTKTTIFQGILFFSGPAPVFGNPVVSEEEVVVAARAAHIGLVIVSAIKVTLPLRARSLPSMFARYSP